MNAHMSILIDLIDAHANTACRYLQLGRATADEDAYFNAQKELMAQAFVLSDLRKMLFTVEEEHFAE